jgi:hypothetical protein
MYSSGKSPNRPWYRVFDHLPRLPDWWTPVFLMLMTFLAGVAVGVIFTAPPLRTPLPAVAPTAPDIRGGFTTGGLQIGTLTPLPLDTGGYGPSLDTRLQHIEQRLEALERRP